MSSTCDSLLQSYCSALREWDTAIAAGAEAVQALQQCFSKLKPVNGSTAEVPKILERLEQLAPSFQLSSYISNFQQQQATAGDADLARTLHEAHAALQSAVTSSKQQLQQLQDLAEQYTDAALSQQLATGLEVMHQQQPQEPQAQESALRQPQQEHLNQPHQSHSPAEPRGLATLGTAVAGEMTEEHIQEALQELQDSTASEEEVALLLSAVVEGLQKELQWMVLAAGSITLDTSPSELETFLTFWQLQPFTDEQAVDAIRQTAAAIADSADDVA